ncbi:MAG: hypothetical protein ACRDX9_02840 [Acidimicrobiia bacterium]
MTGTGERRAWFDTSDRLELVATIVMAAAAIFTAWAAFQSAKWSGIQAIEFSQANAARVESTRFDARANQLRSIDVDVFLSWLDAVGAELESGRTTIDPELGYVPAEGTLSAFYFVRMRDEFKPALDAWLETRPLINPDAPETPFQMAEYSLADAAEAQALIDEAEEHSAAALTSNQNSDNHVLTAVALALAIFFAGISSKLNARNNRLGALILAVAIFLGAGVVLAFLPKVALF